MASNFLASRWGIWICERNFARATENVIGRNRRPNQIPGSFTSGGRPPNGAAAINATAAAVSSGDARFHSQQLQQDRVYTLACSCARNHLAVGTFCAACFRFVYQYLQLLGIGNLDEHYWPLVAATCKSLPPTIML
jgi:hypothetical protein